jgi:hypothetical protein
MAADLDHLARETANIANTMMTVNETMHEVDDVITVSPYHGRSAIEGKG